MILGKCKAKDLVKAITEAWFAQTEIWQLDETDNEVVYTCQDCHQEFKAKQGSRIKYCDSCMLKRIKSGKKLKRK